MPVGAKLGAGLASSTLAKPYTPPDAATPDLHYYRSHRGSDPLATDATYAAAYVWGRHTWEAQVTSTFLLPANQVVFIPHIFPKRCRVASLLYQSVANVGSGLRFGIYGSRNDGLIFPDTGAPLWEHEDDGPENNEALTMAPGLLVEGGSLLWLALLAATDTGDVQTRGMVATEAFALGGLSLDAWSNGADWGSNPGAAPVVGWRVPRAYALGLPEDLEPGDGEAAYRTHSGGTPVVLPALGFTFGVP
jgi:hypothetical protein